MMFNRVCKRTGIIPRRPARDTRPTPGLLRTTHASRFSLVQLFVLSLGGKRRSPVSPKCHSSLRAWPIPYGPAVCPNGTSQTQSYIRNHAPSPGRLFPRRPAMTRPSSSDRTTTTGWLTAHFHIVKP